MLKNLFIKIAKLLAPDYFRDMDRRVQEAEYSANQRFAEYISKMDPFEPLLKKFHGVFSEEYERVEDKLDARGRLMMMMWGYQQRNDPAFKYMTEWVMNTQGNATIKRGNPTAETILYGRAQISNMILFVREVNRLGSLYDERLAEDRGDSFDSSIPVE